MSGDSLKRTTSSFADRIVYLGYLSIIGEYLLCYVESVVCS
jgi:hypothetical protein